MLNVLQDILPVIANIINELISPVCIVNIGITKIVPPTIELSNEKIVYLEELTYILKGSFLKLPSFISISAMILLLYFCQIRII